MLCHESPHESCRMGRRIVVMKLTCSLGHCECDAHTVHKLSQRRLPADWLAPWDSDCSRMRSKVSSEWLPSYIKATRPVLEIFKMAGYILDSPRTSLYSQATFQHVSVLATTTFIREDKTTYKKKAIRQCLSSHAHIVIFRFIPYNTSLAYVTCSKCDINVCMYFDTFHTVQSCSQSLPLYSN